MYRLFNPLKGKIVSQSLADEPWTGRAIENYRARRRAFNKRLRKAVIVGALCGLVLCGLACVAAYAFRGYLMTFVGQIHLWPPRIGF